MKNKFKLISNILFNITICFILILAGEKSYSQQTIINVPSSEVLPAGDILLKDSNKFGPYNSGGNTSITPSITLGTGFGTEFSTGIGTSVNETHTASVIGNFSAKKVFFLGSSTRLTAGGTVSPYFTSAVHPNTFLYAHLSQRIKKTKTSITAGGYFNGEKSFISSGGVILGVEQVIIPNKLRLAIDWLSGQDTYGKMGVGIKYRPVPTLSITSAVIIPNEDSDNIAFNISISKFISLDDENPIKRRLTNVD